MMASSPPTRRAASAASTSGAAPSRRDRPGRCRASAACGELRDRAPRGTVPSVSSDLPCFRRSILFFSAGRGPRPATGPRTAVCASERLEVFDELALLPLAEIQAEGAVVVVDDGPQVGEAAIVVEAAFLPRE